MQPMYLASLDSPGKIAWGPPGDLGIWGEWLFIFRELGSTANFCQGFWEQAHSFGDLGSPPKSKIKSHLKEKPSFRLIFFLKKSSASGGGGAP